MKRTEARVTMALSPAEALEAFLDPAHLRAWFGVEQALVDHRKGGPFTMAWGNPAGAGLKTVATGHIRAFFPGERLEVANWTWVAEGQPIMGPTALSIEVQPAGPGCELVVAQEGFGEGATWEAYMASVRELWPTALGQAKAFMEGRKAPV